MMGLKAKSREQSLKQFGMLSLEKRKLKWKLQKTEDRLML